jgi:hypothetical protein
MTGNGRLRRGLPPAVGVLLGVGVGYLTNVASGADASVGWLVGLAVTATAWAAWEGWQRARSSADDSGGGTSIRVRQIISMNEGGQVTGVRGETRGARVRVWQRIRRMRGGTAVGVERPRDP